MMVGGDKFMGNGQKEQNPLLVDHKSIGVSC